MLSYQTSLSKANFTADANLTAVPRITGATPEIASYPRFPLANQETMVIPRNLTEEEQAVTSSLDLDED